LHGNTEGLRNPHPKERETHRRVEEVKMANICVNFQREGIEGSNGSACRWQADAGFSSDDYQHVGSSYDSAVRRGQGALTCSKSIHSARIQKDTNKISDQIAELRADLKNADNDKVQLASVRGRKGSDSRTDFGFALERFLENVTVMDRPPSQGSVHSDLIESSENLPSEITGDEAL